MTTQTTGTVTESILRQFKQDIGGQVQQFIFTDYSNKVRLGINTPAEDADYMLRQKYGLLPPQLTHSERNLIQREEQRLARDKR